MDAQNKHEGSVPIMRLHRLILILTAATLAGAGLFLLVNCSNAGGFHSDIVTFRWTLAGAIIGLATGVASVLISWNRYGLRGGILVGFGAGAVAGAIIFAAIGMTTNDPTPLGVIGGGSLIGGILFTRVGKLLAQPAIVGWLSGFLSRA